MIVNKFSWLKKEVLRIDKLCKKYMEIENEDDFQLRERIELIREEIMDLAKLLRDDNIPIIIKLRKE